MLRVKNDAIKSSAEDLKQNCKLCGLGKCNLHILHDSKQHFQDNQNYSRIRLICDNFPAAEIVKKRSID